jgi:hypothetical protein
LEVKFKRWCLPSLESLVGAKTRAHQVPQMPLHPLCNNDKQEYNAYSMQKQTTRFSIVFLSQDASNVFSDAYRNFVLGDDAGKSARLVLVLKPKLGEGIHLGTSLIEINGRAFVKSVQPRTRRRRAPVCVAA